MSRTLPVLTVCLFATLPSLAEVSEAVRSSKKLRVGHIARWLRSSLTEGLGHWHVDLLNDDAQIAKALRETDAAIHSEGGTESTNAPPSIE